MAASTVIPVPDLSPALFASTAPVSAVRTELCPQPENVPGLKVSNVPVPPECLYKRGYTEARCVYEYHYALTDQRLDALQHLVNICLKKAFGRYPRFWSPRPRVKFVGVPSASRDWENYGWGNERKNTKGWLRSTLPGWIECYSSQHCTRRELSALVRARDPHLLHTCQRLLDHMRNESKPEIVCVTLEEGFENDEAVAHIGTDDEPIQLSLQRSAPTELKPNYGDLIRLFVRHTEFRNRHPRLFRTLEATLRKLDSGLQRQQAVNQIAAQMGRKPRSVERELRRVKESLSPEMRKALSATFWPRQTVAGQDHGVSRGPISQRTE